MTHHRLRHESSTNPATISESPILPRIMQTLPAPNPKQEHSSSGLRWRAIAALLLLVPVPTIGVYFGMWDEETAGTTTGDAIYLAGKAWLVILPVTWLLLIERGRISWSPPKHGGFGFGIASGMAIALVIVAAWLLLGEAIVDRQTAREAAELAGLDDPVRYLLLAVYICTINVLIEEYAWRWFCFRQCERLIPAWHGGAAILLCAAFFTLHHVFALAAKFGTVAIILGSLGVFVGGCIWSICYVRYRSIWPGFVSHAIADVAIFAIGWHIIFGG
jgi:uncharacterized protein